MLENLGLSKNESSVYVALLKIGLTSAKAILEETGLHRQLVYDALDSLIEKGLVSYIVQSNRKYFKAADPEQFKDVFNKRKLAVESQEEKFEKILPKLRSMQNISQEQETSVFKGKKGMKSLLDDMLNEGKEMLLLGSSKVRAEAFEYHLKFNIPRFHKIRVGKKIKFRKMFGEDMKLRAALLNKLPFTEARVLPDCFTSNTSLNVYGDKYSIMLWGKQPLGILIKSKEIALAQRKYLERLWKLAKKPKI